MADMIVSGAGTTAVNGTYVENGTYGGKPQYIKNGYYIRYGSGKWASWAIDNGGDYSPFGGTLITYYVGAESTTQATPDLVPIWYTSGVGVSPAPTVTAAPSGTTHDGEVALSSLSYLRTKKA